MLLCCCCCCCYCCRWWCFRQTQGKRFIWVITALPPTVTIPETGPTLNLGPCKSPRICSGRPSSFAICRMRGIIFSNAPSCRCEQFRRHMSSPALTAGTRTEAFQHAGPNVPTILVRRRRPAVGLLGRQELSGKTKPFCRQRCSTIMAAPRPNFARQQVGWSSF